MWHSQAKKQKRKQNINKMLRQYVKKPNIFVDIFPCFFFSKNGHSVQKSLKNTTVNSSTT